MKLLACVLLLLGFFLRTSPDKRTGGCNQEFKFFFKSKHDDAFWIGENLYGDCGESHLIQIFSSSQGNQFYETKLTELKEFDSWHWVEQANQVLKTEEYIAVKSYNGSVNFPVTNISLSPPVANSFLLTQKQTSFPYDCAKHWNKNMGKQGIDLPICKGIKPELVYFYKEGLYFNYTIEQAYLFTQSKYILLFTKSQHTCNGESTMHGFMLLKFTIDN